MKKLVSILVILLSFTLFAGGAAKVKRTAKKVVNAMKMGDLEKIFQYAPKEVREQFQVAYKADSENFQKLQKEMIEELKEATFIYGDVTVDGNKASIDVTMKKDGEEETQKFQFTKEDGKWILENFDL